MISRVQKKARDCFMSNIAMATVRKSDTVPNNIKVPQIGLGYSKGSFASARSG